MEYPGSFLSKRIRHGILAFFVTAFFIIAPLIVLYTVGYRYDWKNGLLRETGSISIDVQPTSASVFINEQKLKEKIPIRLNTVTPNRYQVKFTAPGFYEWGREIIVGNKQTTYLKDIILLKKSEPHLMVSGTLKIIELSSDGQFLLYANRVKDTQEIKLHSLKTEIDTVVLTTSATTTVHAAWAKKNNYFALIAGESPNLTVRLGAADRPTELWNPAFAGNPIERWQWKESSNPEFIFSTKAGLFSASPNTAHITQLSSDHFEQWHFEGSELWTMHFSTSSREWGVTQDRLGFNRFFASVPAQLPEAGSLTDCKCELVHAYNGTVIIQSSANSFLIVTTGHRFTVPAEKWYLSPHNKWLLLWTPWEIWAYTQDQNPYVLNRSGEYVDSVQAIDEFNTLALAGKKGVAAFFPYYLVSNKLLADETASLAIDEKARIIYGTGQINGNQGLWKLEY